MATVDRILPEQLPQIWPDFTEVLRRFPETWYKWWTEVAIRKKLECGDAQLWVISDDEGGLLWYMTEIVTFPKQTALNMWWMAGEDLPKQMPVLLPALRLYAKHVGARYITAAGRKGFERNLKKWGAQVNSVLYEMEV